jgi:hypothetical protein
MSTTQATPSPSANQPQYVEEPVNYVFQITLTGDQALTRVPVPIDRDSDFLWTGLNGSSTGAYTINPVLPSGRYMCSSQIQNGNLVSPAANQPTAIGPPPLYRAGSSGPLLDLTDTSGESNSIELVFSGIRRLRTA